MANEESSNLVETDPERRLALLEWLLPLCVAEEDRFHAVEAKRKRLSRSQRFPGTLIHDISNHW